MVFVWKFLCAIYKLDFHSFIHISDIDKGCLPFPSCGVSLMWLVAPLPRFNQSKSWTGNKFDHFRKLDLKGTSGLPCLHTLTCLKGIGDLPFIKHAGRTFRIDFTGI